MDRRREPRPVRFLHSLPVRISILVFSATLLTSLLVTSVCIRSISSFVHETTEDRFREILETTGKRVELWMEKRQLDLETLRRQPALQNALAAREEDPELSRRRIERSLRRALENPIPFAGLLLTDGDGAPFASAGSEIAPAEQACGFAAGAEGRVLSLDLTDASGERLGALHGLLSRGAFAALLHEPGSGARRIYLVDAGGRLLTRSRDLAIEEPLGRPLPIPNAPPRMRHLSNPTGEKLLASSKRLHHLGWTLVVEELHETAFVPVTRVIRWILVTNLCVVGIFSMLAFYLATWRVHALKLLAEKALRLSEEAGGATHPKDGDADEIELLTDAFHRMTDRLVAHQSELERQQLEIAQANALLRSQNEELQGMNEVLAQLSITDGLTKLHNHRFFQDQLMREVKRSQRTGAPLSLLLVDIDDFKVLNDSLGHALGDSVLEHLSEVMCEVIRDSDFLARYGGDEFALIAPQTDLEGACALGEKLRNAIGTRHLPMAREPLRLTVSVGIAILRGDGHTLFDDADRALYRAKKSGKDCVYSAEDR